MHGHDISRAIQEGQQVSASLLRGINRAASRRVSGVNVKDTPNGLCLPQTPVADCRARHFVITSCTTSLPGVVKIKASTAPDGTTPVTNTPELNAWLGTDAFSMNGDPVWCIPCVALVSGTTVSWLVWDHIKGPAHWEDPTTDGSTMASPQDSPDAATLCDG